MQIVQGDSCVTACLDEVYLLDQSPWERDDLISGIWEPAYSAFDYDIRFGKSNIVKICENVEVREKL